MITKKKFLDKLRTTTKWSLSSSGCIGIKENGNFLDCPATFAAEEVAGLPASEIWKAADNARGHDPKLRKELLKACGLTKKVFK